MAKQPYNTTMSRSQLIAAVNADMTALYATGPGTVTSVGLAPGSSDITVGSPNPVTSSGNIPIDLSAAVKSELALAASALQSISIGTGTGLTGGPLVASGSVVALNSTSIADLALAATSLQPVTGLAGSYTYPSITVSASGQITAISSGTAPPAAANPTGTVGLAAVDGVATTFMRSDAAPPLSPAISPTMTGAWTFTPGVSAIAITVNGASGNYAANFIGNATANASYGIVISAGTSASDVALLVRGQTGVTNFLEVNGIGNTTAYGALSVSGGFGVHGAAPSAQTTGFGTPTGATITTNFPGASATLVQCSEMLAELITILKAYGLIGA